MAVDVICKKNVNFVNCSSVTLNLTVSEGQNICKEFADIIDGEKCIKKAKSKTQ